MSSRVFSYAVSRPAFVVFSALALAFLFKGWIVPSAVMGALAAMKLMRYSGRRDLDALLRLREEKEQHGISRLLSEGERQEIKALQRYAEALEGLGCENNLAREVRARGWQLVRDNGHRDATVELRNFRQSLPPLPSEVRGQESSLHERLREELTLLEAARREVSSGRS